MFDNAEDATYGIFGYAGVLHLLTRNKGSIYDYDDLCDAIVDCLKDTKHLTDEELDDAVIEFWELHDYAETIFNAS